MSETAPRIIWNAFGRPAPEGKTGSQYRLELAAEPRCATCAAEIDDGVPFEPRRGIAGVDNDTFYGHAEYARWGTHVCAACAWLYGDPKRTHRGVLAAGDQGWWPTIGKSMDNRPRWRKALGVAARLPAMTPMSGVLTTDPKPRLWPRTQAATVGAPGVYLHSPDHDWSRWTPFAWMEVARLLAVVDQARALGATKTAVWHGLLLSPALCDKAGIDHLLVLDAQLQPHRGSGALLIATLVA